MIFALEFRTKCETPKTFDKFSWDSFREEELLHKLEEKRVSHHGRQKQNLLILWIVLPIVLFKNSLIMSTLQPVADQRLLIISLTPDN